MAGITAISENFHDLYMFETENRRGTSQEPDSDGRKPKKKYKNKDNQKDEVWSFKFHPPYTLAHIELEPNASKFLVYSAIRSAVLEGEARSQSVDREFSSKKTAVCCFVCNGICKPNNQIECACHLSNKSNRDECNSDAGGGANTGIESDSDDNSEKDMMAAEVPKIVGAGLKSLFELISDARNIQPSLCTKALKALFDVVQGQYPESFRNEPNDLIDPLYELLLDLATVSPGKGAWSSIACSTLIGLCIARGDTGKILKAIAALLMSPKHISGELIPLPNVLSSLQRTVICAALNKPSTPTFFSHGVPKSSLIDTFSLKTILQDSTQINLETCLASDGSFLYLFTQGVLYKVGTGFNGTFKGHIYTLNQELSKEKFEWIGFINNRLYLKRTPKRATSSDKFLLLNPENLTITGSTEIYMPTSSKGTTIKENSVIFCDDEGISAICTNKNEALVIKQIFTTIQSPSTSCYELPLKLARQKFRTLGYATFEDEILNQAQIQKIQTSFNKFEPKLPEIHDVDVLSIACGKEFGLVCTSNGKIYYYGKSASLGLKSIGRTPNMRLTELMISKPSNITQFAIGHDGLHALILNDDGTVYFTGTARRGEDGDNSKNRRQPKPVKPKKLSKIDGHVIVNAAANNGTSAFVTKAGKLIIFGKDTSHCDSMGFVSDLFDQDIIKVALGKAHCIALNSKGQLFSFGMNNKGQCGRMSGSRTLKEDPMTDSVDMDGKRKFDFSTVCESDEHNFAQGQCRVCSVCKECTGFNTSCVSSLATPLESRVPGSVCQCGHGDAGCSKCGICSICASLQEGEVNPIEEPLKLAPGLSRHRNKAVIKKKEKKSGDDIPILENDRDPPRVASLPPQKVSLPTSNPVVQISCGLHHTVVLTSVGEVFTFGSNQYGQLGTCDLQPVIGPTQVKVPGIVTQIAAGSNHTILLTNKGIVYTFGNYQKGQLGRLPTDIQKHIGEESGKSGSPVRDGSMSPIMSQRQKFLWHCSPGSVFGLGPNFGKRVTWIGASGDQTFIKVDESLVTPQMLSKMHVVANKRTILMIPTIPLSFNLLTINRQDGSCTAHVRQQVDFVNMISGSQNLSEMNSNLGLKQRESRNFDIEESKKAVPQVAFCIDPTFNVFWVFDGTEKQMLCYNVLASEIKEKHPDSPNFRAVLSPELCLSSTKSCVSRSQASLNLLSCLDILSSAQDSIPYCFEQTESQDLSAKLEAASSADCQSVNRFENFGGGWGYSGHSIECIRFSTDTDILVCGVALFGGRGEYTCKVKLYDLGLDGGSTEKDGVIIAETREIPYECPSRGKHNVMFQKPVNIFANRWYLISARVSGPSSDCGSSGQSSVTTEDQVVFNFKSSKKSNNGTDVCSGQIPAILYRLVTEENKQLTSIFELDPVQKISKSFGNTVTKECFDSLVVLLKWAWESFKTILKDQKDKSKSIQIKTSLQQLSYVNKSCLRLLKKYTNEIYPKRNNKFKSKKLCSDINSQTYNITKSQTITSKLFLGAPELSASMRKPNTENIQLAESIGNVRALLISILCDDVFKNNMSLEATIHANDILDECHQSFVACFHAFYPTSSLKWNCLCDLLYQMDNGVLYSRLLSGILAGLCNPIVKLRVTFSLLNPGQERQSIVSPSDNSGLPMLSSSESHQYPILVEQMIYRSQQEKVEFPNYSWTFKDVLTRLLDIVALPIRSKIENIYHRTINFNELEEGGEINQGLIDNCCNLISRVLSEIIYHPQCGDYESNLLTSSRSLHCSGNRFARCDVSKTWNTGNFGPDAIAFTVDRPGIAVAGAMVYSGSGSYDYQLELLYDNSSEGQVPHKWESLEAASGSYDQSAVCNDMAEIKFERPIHIKENVRYALRLCSQGARTCSGDSGLNSIRGPDGSNFTFYPCDLSFNGTTPIRGQIPCILYYSTPMKKEGRIANYVSNETAARDAALQIVADITKKCTELLVLARNAMAVNSSSGDKSPNSSNNTHTVDSEHNITPIEEHIDVNWAHHSRAPEANMSATRDLTKRFESFSKNIMETLKRSTNPFDSDVEIGDEIDREQQEANRQPKNGNDRKDDDNQRNAIVKSDSVESSSISFNQMLELFNINSSNMFQNLLPIAYAHIGALASTDPKSSVQILCLVKEILPHVAALNQLFSNRDNMMESQVSELDQRGDHQNNENNLNVGPTDMDLCTTSNHYCIVESDHPYKSGSVSTYRVVFPSCVQWFTIEFDPQSGTSQCEDYLLISIPSRPMDPDVYRDNDDAFFGRQYKAKGANVMVNCYSRYHGSNQIYKDSDEKTTDFNWTVVQKFNSTSSWSQNVLVLPGNKVEFSLETASFYLQDMKANRFGFKCMIVGYDNPAEIPQNNNSLIRLEYELANLGGMCSANLMKKELRLAEEKNLDDSNVLGETLSSHYSLLSKGLALSDSMLTIHQALDTKLPIGSQSNERQFLKDFISGAPGSSGARLAAWLQPEPRLDPNKCELNAIVEPVRYGWPTQLTVTVRDQYGDAVIVPELKVEIKVIPSGGSLNGGKKGRNTPEEFSNSLYGGVPNPPRVSYEPTIKDKMCFKAITFMKPYTQYSFEELRYCNPTQFKATESLFATDNENGTFSVNWTPNAVGNYCLNIYIDDIPLEDVHRVEVREGGVPPPIQTSQKRQMLNKVRKFFTKNSAGLRIRSHPTLQSEEVGILKVNGIISFIDEIENDDGVWVRLSTESIRQHCNTGWYPTEAWCLQFNQHLGKTLLHPIEETILQTTDEKKPAENEVEKVSQQMQEITIIDEDPPSIAEDALPTITNPFTVKDENKQQNNLGNAIAGVVGGSASKLQAIHKWFKKEEVNNLSKRRGESFDTNSPSVREIVRSLGQDFGKSNGNAKNSADISEKQDSLSDLHHPQMRVRSNSVATVVKMSPKHSPRRSRFSSKMPLKEKNCQNIPIPPKAFYGPPKRALPPSVAESLRAVFAAFLWHEGLVHDAMACASFLKFHPSLQKQGVANNEPHERVKPQVAKEFKAKQRHSVEVANTGNYLNIRPSTLDTLNKTGNTCVNNRKLRRNNDELQDNVNMVALSEVTICELPPPSLRCLVYLWEELSNMCIQVVQTNSFVTKQQKMSPNENPNISFAKNDNIDRENKKIKRRKKDDASWCELCEIFMPIPVTYHMRLVHPGCGKPARGKGYNSVGMYCEGWAGNCGEGGKGASSWFLMCDACREKYILLNKNVNVVNETVDQNTLTTSDINIFGGKTGALLANSEIYTTMKDNAIFLLELNSSDNMNVLKPQRRSPQMTMPIVAEDPIPGPSYRVHSRSKYTRRSQEGSWKKSTSPDLMWIAPRQFSCLETLGTTISKAFPNELFEVAKDNFFEGQLSEMSYYDSVNAAASDQLTTPVSNSQTGTLSKVHRSMSMGQGWSNLSAPQPSTKMIGDQEEPTFTPRVVMRRKNNISNDEGTLLICYPSENLRKLVPENLVNSAAPPQPHQRPVTIATDENPIMTEQLVLQKDSNNGLTLQKIKTPDKQIQAADYEENLNKLLSRPVINFITKQHDLVKMRSAMKRSIRITICRIYALQAYNWLIRSVTQSVCLHDIMWWFVSSLNASNSDDLDGEEALEHPGHTTQFSGSISQILSQSLHLFLQSVADITLLLPSGSSLQRVAIECFGIKFNQADHQFLHRSHVFGNISKILSKSDEQNEQMVLSTLAADGVSTAPGARFIPYVDLTGMFEITVSSRPALADSLIDNSTETFWESDEEDRNKCKIIEISMTKINYACKKILVHIDNTRDIQQKVSNIVFFGGQSLGDTHLLRSIEIDQKSCTWVSTRIPDETFTHYRLELRGPENTLRVRQIKLVGVCYPSTDEMDRKDPKLVNASHIQQKICENETLRVFRLLSGQVFGKLIATNCENSLTNSLLADSLDLREHMVGILFSRSKLSHLQKQVIVYIVHAIKKEAQRSKEDWELFNATTDFKELSATVSEVKSDSNSEKFKSPDTYCFEMLSMVLALSGSTVGRSYLSHQHGLLKDLLTLLHTGSDRIQRQVTALLRRILPEISPEIFADLLGIQKLPPTNYLIEHTSPNDFDMNRLGILDIFLAVIAKSLQLQLKIKTTTKSQAEKSPCFIKLCGTIDFSVHLLQQVKKTPPVRMDEDGEEEMEEEFVFPAQGDESCRKSKDSIKNLNQRWFLKGIISIKQAENIISFIRDMASGKMSERWSSVTKAAIAEAVLNLTRLDVVFRSPDICVKTSTLWLALASLCVLDMDHVEKLSSGQWTKVSECRPMCSNHDDGETSAIIQCEQCGSLCGDCDRFLHLNRRTRNHRRTVCKEEEEAIRVELHETCGRTKLFWLLALADSKTLKGIVEFRDGNHTLISGPLITVGCCRFCGVTGNSGLLEIGNVCADTQCQEHAANSCMKIKPCGHPCGGVANEKKCLPCLQHVNLENKLAEATNDPKLTQDADDMCMICFVEALSCAPAIQLECGHVFHYHCCSTVLEKKWSGPRITFGFSLCPICKSDIQHEMLSEILEPINSLRNDVKRKALMRIKYEGVIKSTDEKYLTTMAMDRYAYYVCFKCKKSYFGGEARCNAEIGEKFDPEELVCGGCSDVAKAQMCPKHGTDFLEYKCRYCCSVAVFFCFGTTHFCDTCHDDFQRLSNIAKNKLPQCPVGPKGKPLPGDECPLHIVHPPTGEEFALGCGVCRNAQTF